MVWSSPLAFHHSVCGDQPVRRVMVQHWTAQCQHMASGASCPTFFQWESFWKFQNQFVPEMKAEICAHLLLSINVYFHNLKNAARVLSLQGFHTVECSLVHSGPMHCFNATSLQFIRKNVSRKHFEHCLPYLKQVASYISWVSAGTDINWLFTGCLRVYSWFLSDVFWGYIVVDFCEIIHIGTDGLGFLRFVLANESNYK